MSRRIPCHIFMLPTNPPHLNPYSLQPSFWATSGGPWMNRSAIASITEPAPLGGPESKTYMPTSLMTTLLASLHASPGSGHLGSQHTLSLLKARYWWPSMAWDVSQYVRGCSVCAISETPHHLPTRKLVPLPIPCRPWSHVGVDFVTDLPKSEGYTCKLVAVDRFYKACKLILL